MGLLSRIKALGKPKNVLTMQGTSVVPGQRVQIEGAGAVYVVLSVDHQRHLADLLPLGTVRSVQPGIPLALLTPAEESDRHVNEMKISA